MAKLKLSDKLSVLDRSDLSDLDVPVFTIIACIFLVTVITWFFSSFMVSAILHMNTFLFKVITQSSLLSWNHLYFILTITSVAFIRALLYQRPWFSDAFGDGSSQALHHFHKTYSANTSPQKIIKQTYQNGSITSVLKRVLVTIMTLAFGGSGGVEGPAIPIGQRVGVFVAKLFSVNNLLFLRVLEMCGISAAITTLLHAPMTGSVFALELVFGCKFVYRLLLCSLASSLIAFILSNHLLEGRALFTLAPHPISYHMHEYVIVIITSIFVSLVSGLGLLGIFKLIHWCYIPIPQWLQAPTGALLCALTAIFAYHYAGIEPRHLLGVGEETIVNLFRGDESPLGILSDWRILIGIVVIKIFLTGLTIAAGGSAGLLIPAVYVGVASSSALYFFLKTMHFLPMINGLHTLFMVTGIASALICVMDLPIATVIFISEICDVSFTAPCIVAVTISRVISYYCKKALEE